VRSAQGLTLSSLEPLPAPLAGDLILVPGTSSATLAKLDRAAHPWLRAAHAAGATIAAVCSGAFTLARAGLLDSRRCTTHWKLTAELAREVPSARVLDNRLFVDEGDVVTSAGVVSGIDMALALVEKHHGPLVVARVAREMVVYLRRAGDDAQTSVYLDHRTHLHPGVHRVQDFLVAHPERKPTLDELARVAAMSPRNLARVFRRATALTPKQFAHKVKLQVARDLAGDPQRTVEQIAASCGFEDGRQLRRLWKQTFGTSISTFRASHAQRSAS
jgi:transcriptional regulator GlxA family with amidase domain